jgi:hypothetical protein
MGWLSPEATSWILLFVVIAGLAILVTWVIRSFRRWPTTDDERRSFLWGRRGGGDL